MGFIGRLVNGAGRMTATVLLLYFVATLAGIAITGDTSFWPFAAMGLPGAAYYGWLLWSGYRDGVSGEPREATTAE